MSTPFVMQFVEGQFFQVATANPGGPVGRAAKRGDGRFSAHLEESPDDKQLFDTFDEAVEAAWSLVAGFSSRRDLNV